MIVDEKYTVRVSEKVSSVGYIRLSVFVTVIIYRYTFADLVFLSSTTY